MRPVNPTEVRLRHIVRCDPGDPGAVTVGRVSFRAADPTGLSGRAGWISGEYRPALSDDSTASIRLANTVGADGKHHRSRFKIITDDRARLGEEWIEIWREGHRLIGVFTPTSYKISRTEITLELADPLALTTLVREEGAHMWNASPRDALDYYTRLEMPTFLQDFRQLSTSDLTVAGWTFPEGTTGFTAGPSGLVVAKTGGSGLTSAILSRALTLPTSRDEAWTLTATVTPIVEGGGTAQFRWTLGPIQITTDVKAHTVTIGSADPINLPNDVKVGQTVDLRLWRRGEWVVVSVNGRTIDTIRPGTVSASTSLTLSTSASTMQLVVSRTDLITVEPFLADPTVGDRMLPGAPTPGGLWGRYFAEPDAASKAAGNTTTWEALILKPGREPVAERLDPVNFTAANPPAWQEAAVGNKWFAVRWTGSVFLDLETGDRNLKVVGGTYTRTRLWIGKTGPAYTIPHLEGTGTVTGTSLRTHLGQVKGWFPIVIEADHRDGSGGVILQDRAGAGAYSQIPTDRLSPYGVFTDTVQRESHRTMVSQITEAFGYQWVIEPRSLESGGFPGKLIPKVRQGRDTTVTITDREANGPEMSGSVADSADRVLVDAAGLPTVDGAGQMSVDMISPAAGEHLFLSTASDQASEITDERLLRQRADSLLALRAGAWEQMKVDGAGQSELVDTFPLTGQLALMNWEPGDGVRLDIKSVGVTDLTPRQLTGISWPLRPDGVGAPSITWRQRPRGARDLLLRALRASISAQRTYQGRIQTIDGSIGANPAAGSPTTPSILMLPGGSRVVRLELRVSYPGGIAGSGTIEVNGTSTGQVVAGQSPIDLTRLAGPITAVDQRVSARLISVSGQLFEIQLSAEVLR